jgi:hypothetical protein
MYSSSYLNSSSVGSLSESTLEMQYFRNSNFVMGCNRQTCNPSYSGGGDKIRRLYSKNNKSKKGWRLGSSGRMPG